MAITIHLQVGESIHQALARCVRENYSGGDGRTIAIPPGVSIVGSSIRQTRIIERRTTGIPFLSCLIPQQRSKSRHRVLLDSSGENP